MLVYSPSWSAHLQDLENVMHILQQQHLFAKLSKCQFGFEKIDYLGHTVSRNGVAMDQNKIKDRKCYAHTSATTLVCQVI
ncbi:hypothetical protein Lalb_Chr20g0114701 [Lupinus albus]|uniref:Reverse transcriptase domain-containing protein n=1 Tax=Lupinus albus TaxID=3870 RepID=A0A6A4NQA0_LUPAL|nr:hypothetical protein Lalb_Chr20g0114701 [Lupinus albus]